jgi:catechol 2,3-dioxygenase-like lactoylglutathione lyase family enzyme
MATDPISRGIHHLLVETTDYDATLRFWQDLGFTVDFETGHGSAKLDPPTPGPYVFVDLAGPGRSPTVQIYLDITDHTAVAGDWEATHWGTFVQPRTDPDDRTVWLQEVGPGGH